MELHAIDALTGLRAALEAPEERRLALFREGVMEPLRPFWEPFMGWMPQAPAADQGAGPSPWCSGPLPYRGQRQVRSVPWICCPD